MKLSSWKTTLAFALAACVGFNVGNVGRAQNASPNCSATSRDYYAKSEYVTVEGNGARDVAKECDKIVKGLEKRYGKPKRWRSFPVRFAPGKSKYVAGYTRYVEPNVIEVKIYQTFEESRGGTLDHELTHAFFFYYFDSNFNLLLNEGLAQNSETINRARYRDLVYRRYIAGEFDSLERLYRLESYDFKLLIYTQGFGVVDFLIARGGSKWFAAFVDDLTENERELDDALLRFYGYRSVKELEKDWLEYVGKGQDRAKTRALGRTGTWTGIDCDY